MSKQVYSGHYIGKVNHYLKIKSSKDLLFFGNSRTNQHINTDMIKFNGFNIGVDGTSLAHSFTLISLLPKNKKQLVFLNIDSRTLFDENYKGQDITHLIYKFHTIKKIRDEIVKLNQFNKLQDIFWCLDFNFSAAAVIKNFFFPKYNFENHTGHTLLAVPEFQRKILLKTINSKKNNFNCEDNLKLNPLSNNYLDKIISFCKKNKKTLVLFTSPIYNDRCKSDNRKIKEILNKKGVIYYDLSDYFINNNKIEYWRNTTHLSYIGANIFTLKIISIIQENKKISLQ